jgi:WD40 repeat protein
MAAARTCRKCGAALPIRALEGLCPRCLMQRAMAGDATERSLDDTGPGDSPGPPRAELEATDAHTPPLGSDATRPPADATGDWTPDPTDPDATTEGRGTAPDLPRGTTIRYFGDYELRKELGRGGMGVVYQARQVSLNRPVALKMIKAGVLADDAELRRFQNEAEAVALLDHPGIVPVYEVGEHEGQRYLSMKLVDGGNLAEQLVSFKDNPRAAVALLIETAKAVHHAHMRGILHRDLKPANILIDAQGHPHITDFGLAKLMESDVELTASGAIMGTPAYMSPEQAAGRRGALGLATDVYGLGAIFYALLTARAPFGGDSVIDTLDAVRTRPPESPRKHSAKVPRDLELICLKCLEKNPADRYPTAGALADDLRRWAADEPVSVRAAGAVERVAKWARRKPTLAAAYSLGLLALLLGGLGGAAVWQWRAAARARDGERHARAKTQTALDSAKVSEAAAVKARDGEANARATLARVEYGRTMEVALQEWRDNNPAATRALLASTQAELRGWEWRYLQRLCHSELLELKGHTAPVFSASFSPDGSRIVTVGGDATAKVWDARTSAELLTLKGHTGLVRSASFSPDGSRIVTASTDQTAGVWDAQTGAEILTLEGHNGQVASALFSPDGSRIVTASPDSTAKVWDARTGAELLTLKGHMGSYLVAASFSPDGSRVVTADNVDNKGWTRVWDARNGTEILTLEGHSTPLSSVSFNPDGSRIVTTSLAADGSAKVWDARTGAELFTLKGHNNGFGSASFSPDGSRLLTGGGDGEIKVWDARTGAAVCTLKGSADNTGTASIAFSPDGSRIVAHRTWDKTAQIWDAQTGAEILTLKGHTGFVYSASFSPDGSRVVTGSADLTARIWDARSDPESFRFKEPNAGKAVTLAGAVRSASFSPDGSRIVTASRDQTARVWDAASGDEVLTLKGRSGELVDGSFSRDGSRVVTQSMFGTTTIWDARTGAEILTLKGARFSRGYGTGLPSHERAAAFSPDGSRIVTAGPDHTAKVSDARTGAEILTLKGQTGRVSAAPFSPDGSRIVTAGWGPTAHVWDSQTGAEILTLKGHTAEVRSASFSHDGSRVVTGSSDNTAKVWDAKTGAEILTLKGHTGPVASASFSHDGSRIVTAGEDKTVKLWDAASGAELLTLKHTGGFNSPLFSPDGSRILTISLGKAQIWDSRPFPGSALARANRLPAILNGEDQPANNSERLAFARMAYDGKRFTAAARHWALALADDPILDANCWNHYRFHAACAAALAAAGQGHDEPLLDGAAKARLRRQALDWLKTELTAWKVASEFFEPAIQEKAGNTLAHWKEDTDLASIRDEKELARLPEEERKQWQSLWANVEVLLKPTREKPVAVRRFRTKQAAIEYKRNEILGAVTLAATQAWLGQQKDYSATCDRVLELAKDAKEPGDAERAAKICSLRASDAKTHEAALVLARRAVELGNGHPLIFYFQMALGMAEYRCGRYAEADRALSAAAQLGKQDYYVSGTTAFYRAMSLFKQGKEAEARKLASEAITKMKPLPADQKNPLVGDPNDANADDLILWMAFKEASALLGLKR